MKLTAPWRKELLRAQADGERGLVQAPSSNGLTRAAWHTKMSRMMAAGLFTPCAHGGYYVTPAGLDALEKNP